MFTKRELIQLLRDRLAISLLAAFMLTMLILLVMTILNIHVSDVQLPVRYSGYGSTNIYRDHWSNLLSFGLFAVLTAAINGYLIVKLHETRRWLSIGLSMISIIIGLLAIIVAASIFRLAALSL